ncbi:radical SAM protein [Candidatus Woesearchaeota archaeon]|nr:radical SAM protein [Candidatus Woesearchaeota archaeon]
MSSDSFLEKWRNNIEDLVGTHPLQIISWESTRRCNLNCLHCGSPSEEVELQEELTTDEVIGAFNQIAEDFDMSLFRHINITGGEPFVRKDLLTILEEISKHPFYRNIDIQTNGVVLARNPDLFEQLKKYGVTGIGISIDGIQQTHDTFRGRIGSYDLAFKAAKTAVESGLTVTVSTVANATNINEISQLYDLVREEIKPRIFRVMTLDPIGRASNEKYLLSSEQTQEVIGFLLKEYTANCEDYHDPKTTMVELGCGGWLGKDLEGLVRPFIFHCVAGINNLGMLYDGKLAACSNIPREFGFEGDLRKDRIKDVWDNKYQRYRNFEWKKTGDCQDCGEWDYCHGGPMHKRSINGSMTDCLYQTIANGKDYWVCSSGDSK